VLSGRESGSDAGILRLSMRWPKVSPHPIARSVAWQKSFPGLASQVGVADPSGQHGRGLLIVASLATDWGVHGGLDGRTAWLELGRS
jgi:hypothetical protein